MNVNARGISALLGVAAVTAAVIVVVQQPAGATPIAALTRVAVSSSGSTYGQGDGPALSSDGRYVAFWTADALVSGDTNGQDDVYRRDLSTNQIVRVSLTSTGAQISGWSVEPAISADGRYVAFVSNGTSIVPGDLNSAADVFVRDTVLNKTARISVNSNNEDAVGGVTSERPTISADGRYVAFGSNAANLDPADTNTTEDIFLRDITDQKTTLVSKAAAVGNDISRQPVMTPNGRFVAFLSNASNLVASDTNGSSDAFVRDLWTGTTARVSVGAGGAEANNASLGAVAISNDGLKVAFGSLATNLVAGDTNAVTDVFVRNVAAGTTARVSVAALGVQANDASISPSLSGDGRYVAFASGATNLVPGDTNGHRDVFLQEIQFSDTTRLSAIPNGAQANNTSNNPAISSDGRYLAFASAATNLFAGDSYVAGVVRRPITGSRYRTAVSADAPSGWWPLDDAGSTVAPLAGTVNGSWSAPAGTRTVTAGGALDDAPNVASSLTSAYAQIVNAPGATLTGTGSVELLFRSPSLGPDGSACLLGNGPGAVTSNWQLSLVGAAGGGQVTFSGGRGNLTSGQIPAVGDWSRWIHLVLTVSGSQARLYVNNQLVASSNTMASTYTPTGNTLVVGEYAHAPGGCPFGSLVQHLAVYPTALSAAQVDAHYRATGRQA